MLLIYVQIPTYFYVYRICITFVCFLVICCFYFYFQVCNEESESVHSACGDYGSLPETSAVSLHSPTLQNKLKAISLLLI